MAKTSGGKKSKLFEKAEAPVKPTEESTVPGVDTEKVGEIIQEHEAGKKLREKKSYKKLYEAELEKSKAKETAAQQLPSVDAEGLARVVVWAVDSIRKGIPGAEGMSEDDKATGMRVCGNVIEKYMKDMRWKEEIALIGWGIGIFAMPVMNARRLKKLKESPVKVVQKEDGKAA